MIACIGQRVESSDELEVWSGGAPQGPAQSRDTIEFCSNETGIELTRIADIEDVNAHRSAVLTMALMGFGDRRDYLTVEDFDHAMEVARCVEREALADQNFFSEDQGVSAAVGREAMFECAPDLAEYAVDPGNSAVDVRRALLVTPIAVGNLNYIRAYMASHIETQE